MVAKITAPVSIQTALDYNERKVQKGTGCCLYAGNFLQNASELSRQHKLERFQKLIQLNSSKTNTLHISLNFHPSEKLSNEKLVQIVETYMRKIGFGEQPFLAYTHFDAAHPHLHIVTTNITEKGRRIDTYNIGKWASEKARQEIETEFGLINALGSKEEKKPTDDHGLTRKIKYGVTETKRGISNVLAFVLQQYLFTSIIELNAILKLYNVLADRGSAKSRTYRYGGLNYRLLNESGNKTGVPIKASSIYFKPTLKYLQARFQENESLRLAFKPRLKTAIDWVLSKKPTNMEDFIFQLKKENVAAIIDPNETDFQYGITFIDHRTKVVFEGIDIGTQYTVRAIKEKISSQEKEEKHSFRNLLEKRTPSPSLFEKQPKMGISRRAF